MIRGGSLHKLFHSHPIREDLNRKWTAGGSDILDDQTSHHNTGLGHSCASATPKGCIESLKRGIKVIKGMVGPNHWTLLLALGALKRSSILLFLVISAEIWVCGYYLSKASIVEDEIAIPCMPRVQLSLCFHCRGTGM